MAETLEDFIETLQQCGGLALTQDTSNYPPDQQFELFLCNIATAAFALPVDDQKQIRDRIATFRTMFHEKKYPELLNHILELLTQYHISSTQSPDAFLPRHPPEPEPLTKDVDLLDDAEESDTSAASADDTVFWTCDRCHGAMVSSFRYTCDQCPDIALCTDCYPRHRDEHEQDHAKAPAESPAPAPCVPVPTPEHAPVPTPTPTPVPVPVPVSPLQPTSTPAPAPTPVPEASMPQENIPVIHPAPMAPVTPMPAVMTSSPSPAPTSCGYQNPLPLPATPPPSGYHVPAMPPVALPMPGFGRMSPHEHSVLNLRVGEQLVAFLRELDGLTKTAAQSFPTPREYAIDPTVPALHAPFDPASAPRGEQDLQMRLDDAKMQHNMELQHLATRLAEILSLHLEPAGPPAPDAMNDNPPSPHHAPTHPQSLRNLLETVRKRRTEHDASIPEVALHRIVDDVKRNARAHLEEIFACLDYPREQLEALRPSQADTRPMLEFQRRIQGLCSSVQVESLQAVLNQFSEMCDPVPEIIQGTSLSVQTFVDLLDTHCYQPALKCANVRSFCNVKRLRDEEVPKVAQHLSAAKEASEGSTDSTTSYDELWNNLQTQLQNMHMLRLRIDDELEQMVSEKQKLQLDNLSKGRVDSVQSLRERISKTQDEIAHVQHNIDTLAARRGLYLQSLQESQENYKEATTRYHGFLAQTEEQIDAHIEAALQHIRQVEALNTSRVAYRQDMMHKARELKIFEEASQRTLRDLADREALLRATLHREERNKQAETQTMHIIDEILAEVKKRVDQWTNDAQRQLQDNRLEWQHHCDLFVECLNGRIAKRSVAKMDRLDDATAIEAEMARSHVLGDDARRAETQVKERVCTERIGVLTRDIEALNQLRREIITTIRDKSGYHRLDSEIDAEPDVQPILARLSSIPRIGAPTPRPPSSESSDYPRHSFAPSFGPAYLQPEEPPMPLGASILDLEEVSVLPHPEFRPEELFMNFNHAPQIRSVRPVERSGLGWLKLQDERYACNFSNEPFEGDWEVSACPDDYVYESDASPEMVHIRRIHLDKISQGEGMNHIEELCSQLCTYSSPNWHNIREFFVEGDYFYVVLKRLGPTTMLKNWLIYWQCHALKAQETGSDFQLQSTFITHIAKQFLNAVNMLHTLGISCGESLVAESIHLGDFDIRLLDLHIFALLDKYPKGVQLDGEYINARAPEEEALYAQYPAGSDELLAALQALDLHKSDVYRIGLLIMQLMVPEALDLPQREQIERLRAVSRKFLPNLEEAVMMMLRPNPAERPTCQELLELPIMRWPLPYDGTPCRSHFCALTKEQLSDDVVEVSGKYCLRQHWNRHLSIWAIDPFNGTPIRGPSMSVSSSQSSIYRRMNQSSVRS